MKKTGFTLSELLIALSIIAIASAIVAPAISNIMPDKYKTRILKYYRAVESYTTDMLENEGIYYAHPDFDSNNMPIIKCNNTEITVVDLTCTDQPLTAPYNSSTYSGADKYPYILSNMLFGSAPTVVTSNSKWSKTGSDNAVWVIQAVTGGGYVISVDMDPGTNSKNCSYNSSTCKTPDTFLFKVSKAGDVSPGDALTEVFIKNPSRTSKKDDLDEAATVTTVF